eukprot:6258510-Pyramimonas_sp.AAC.2
MIPPPLPGDLRPAADGIAAGRAGGSDGGKPVGVCRRLREWHGRRVHGATALSWRLPPVLEPPRRRGGVARMNNN